MICSHVFTYVQNKTSSTLVSPNNENPTMQSKVQNENLAMKISQLIIDNETGTLKILTMKMSLMKNQ